MKIKLISVETSVSLSFSIPAFLPSNESLTTSVILECSKIESELMPHILLKDFYFYERESESKCE